MKRRVIVHIGMHKTGSTSIQQTLHTRLTDPAFEYANFGPANHTGPVCSLFSDSPETIPMHRKRGWGKEMVERFNVATRERVLREFEACEAPTMIISGEGICNLEEAALRRLRKFLGDYFADIVVVGYVRSPRSYMESAFQQLVQDSNARVKVDMVYPQYRHKFEKFDWVFGRENVHLWKFSPNSFPHGDVVLDFCRRLNIAMSRQAVQRVNQAISREALSLLFAYRRFGPGYGYRVGVEAIHSNKKMVEALQTIRGGKFIFAPEVVRPILDANREDIHWMEERLADSLAENLEESDDDVHSEEDLLRIRPSTVEALKGLLRVKSLPEGKKGETPQEVAQLVHWLRMKLTRKRKSPGTAMGAGKAGQNGETSATQGESKMKVMEMVELMKQENPKLLGKLSEKKTAAIIRKALAQLAKQIDAMEEGEFKVQGLGSFRVRQTEQERSGEKVMGKRIAFRASKPSTQDEE